MDIRLIADVGGTNIRLAFVDSTRNILVQEKFKCAQFKSLYEAINFFITKNSNYKSSGYGAISIAASITGDKIEMTNLNWSFSQKEIINQLGFKHILFCNDFGAIAHGLPYLQSKDLIKLGGGEPVLNATKGVFGAGTGLGTSYSYFNNGSWLSVSTEQGFSIINGYTDEECRIIDGVRKLTGDPIAENLLSGRGLVNIYNAICNIKSVEAVHNDAPSIGSNYNNDNICKETIDNFHSFMGIFAANVVVNMLSVGGVYIAGGIAQKLQDSLIKSRFRESFEKRGREKMAKSSYQFLIKNTPTYLIKVDVPAFIGLSHMVFSI